MAYVYNKYNAKMFKSLIIIPQNSEFKTSLKSV